MQMKEKRCMMFTEVGEEITHAIRKHLSLHKNMRESTILAQFLIDL